MTEALTTERDDACFLLIARRHGHMATLACDGVPAAGDAYEAGSA